MTGARLSPDGSPIGKRPLAAALEGALLAAVALSLTVAACDSGSADSLKAINDTDCLPHVVLTDRTGKPVDLASLKGKPALVDFFYTRCPGPCQMMTAKLARVADRLGNELGSKVQVVSVTIDPEHDRPTQLTDFAKTAGRRSQGMDFSDRHAGSDRELAEGVQAQTNPLLRWYRRAHHRDLLAGTRRPSAPRVQSQRRQGRGRGPGCQPAFAARVSDVRDAQRAVHEADGYRRGDCNCNCDCAGFTLDRSGGGPGAGGARLLEVLRELSRTQRPRRRPAGSSAGSASRRSLRLRCHAQAFGPPILPGNRAGRTGCGHERRDARVGRRARPGPNQGAGCLRPRVLPRPQSVAVTRRNEVK